MIPYVYKYMTLTTCQLFKSILTMTGSSDLTHIPMDKMAAISHKVFSYAFSWISLKFVANGPTDSNPALV